MSKDLKKIIGDNIKECHSGGFCNITDKRGQELRTLSKKLSLRKLAKRVGVSPSFISQLEQGKVYCSVPMLVKIAEELTKLNGFTITINDLIRE